MTDREMVALLKDYANAYIEGRPYTLNYGLVLMIAQRMEHLIEMAENYTNDTNTKQND